jgi:hypothetical protein
LRYLLDSVYWTEKAAETTVPLDPLGLDQMKEELADKLVPYLTGRTDSVEEAFWAMTFLRWAIIDSGNEGATVKRFLEWERCLKLVWAHFGSTPPYPGFRGVQRARSQSDEPGAPYFRFRPLLVNQRVQGLLGSYLRPLRKLGLVEPDALVLSDMGRLWTNSVSSEPELSDGDWPGWKSAFMSISRSNLRVFAVNLQGLLRARMPSLYAALSHARWSGIPSWNGAARWLGDDAPYARLAQRFGPWADRVREVFDEIVFDGRKEPVRILPFRGVIPPQLEGPRWGWIRAELGEGPISKAKLVEWHRREYLLRGKSTGQLWILGRGDSFEIRRYNGSQTRTTKSDFRWSNAVAMMAPGAK